MHKYGLLVLCPVFLFATFVAAENLSSSQPANGWELRPATQKGFSAEYVAPDHGCVVSVRTKGKGVRIVATQGIAGKNGLQETITIQKKRKLEFWSRRAELKVRFLRWENGAAISVRDDWDIFAMNYASLARAFPAPVKKLFSNHYDLK